MPFTTYICLFGEVDVKLNYNLKKHRRTLRFTMEQPIRFSRRVSSAYCKEVTSSA